MDMSLNVFTTKHHNALEKGSLLIKILFKSIISLIAKLKKRESTSLQVLFPVGYRFPLLSFLCHILIGSKLTTQPFFTAYWSTVNFQLNHFESLCRYGMNNTMRYAFKKGMLSHSLK